MLKHRLITSAVLIPLLVLAIWFFSVWAFAAFVGFIVAVAAWEWAGLLGIKSLMGRSVYTVLVIGAVIGAFYSQVNQVLFAALLMWVWAMMAVFSAAIGGSALGFQARWVKGLAGLLVLPACWVALNVLHASMVGPFWLLFCLMLVWAVDTGAYIVGRLWGKHPLASRLSPKKTWEGFFGGVALSLLVAVVVMFAFQVSFNQALWVYLLTLLTSLFAVLGDLFESLLKRQAGIKDSGCILPGHGGMLDRIDGLLAALPIFALGSLFLGY